MNKRTCFICINGILTDPRKPDAWTDEFVDWIIRKLPDQVTAVSYEYNATPLLRRWGQAERAQHIAAKVNAYRRSGYRVVLVGHSNGCDLIARVIGTMSAEVDTVHLFAPAADEQDYDRAIEAGSVRQIHIYGSPNDRALGIGARLSRWLTFGKLGYGSLGLRGKEFAARNAGIVFDHSRADYGHSDWFSPRQNFIATMMSIAHTENLLTAPVLPPA